MEKEEKKNEKNKEEKEDNIEKNKLIPPAKAGAKRPITSKK